MNFLPKFDKPLETWYYIIIDKGILLAERGEIIWD